MRFAAIFLSVFLFGCADSSSKEQASKNDKNPAAPVVTDERTDLVFSWVADGGPQVGSSVEKVPPGARKAVRVQIRICRRRMRDPSIMFLADLTMPGADGRYPVKTISRTEYEAGRRAAVPVSNPVINQTVVMYATRHCPVCVKARRWLLEQKIPYVERDLELDKQAAQDLQKKGQAQGVPTNGVPIFEIDGRLLPGFDKATIPRNIEGPSVKLRNQSELIVVPVFDGDANTGVGVAFGNEVVLSETTGLRALLAVLVVLHQLFGLALKLIEVSVGVECGWALKCTQAVVGACEFVHAHYLARVFA